MDCLFSAWTLSVGMLHHPVHRPLSAMPASHGQSLVGRLLAAVAQSPPAPAAFARGPFHHLVTLSRLRHHVGRRPHLLSAQENIQIRWTGVDTWWARSAAVGRWDEFQAYHRVSCSDVPQFVQPKLPSPPLDPADDAPQRVPRYASPPSPSNK